MAPQKQQIIVEDIPLIDDPTTKATATSEPSLRLTRRKPVPAPQRDSNFYPHILPPDHRGYSTVSEIDEERLEYGRRSSDAKPRASELAVEFSEPAGRSNRAEHSNWLPYALRLPWLLSTIAFGILVLVLVVVLHYESSKHYGLIKDSGSPALYFAWRFMPTLVAVFYVTLLMMILDAVKRTEAFARLTSSHGASAESSVLREPGAWWTAVIDSFPRKQNGSRFSTAMLSAATAYLLGLFVISPFSAAFVQPKDVSMSEHGNFDTISLDADLPLSFQSNTLDFAQTMANILQNVTTSPWIVGGHAIVPFWPSQDNRPDGAKINNSGKSWKANATVLKSEMIYEELQLTGINTAMNWTYSSMPDDGTIKQPGSINLTSYVFKTQSGCEYGLAGDPDYDSFALWWSSLSYAGVAGFKSSSNYGTERLSDYGGNQSVLLNYTSHCNPGEVLLIIPPVTATLQPHGYLFRPSYYSATVTVTVSTGPDATIVRFDEDTFNQTRKPLTADYLNTTIFSDIFLSPEWNNFLVDPDKSDGRASVGGPANALAALYEFQVPSLMEDPALLETASRIREQFFGRVLQSSLQKISGTNSLHGIVLKAERRVVVISFAAIILEVILGMSICLLFGLLRSTRLSRRPLGVAQDPAFVNTIVSLTPLLQDKPAQTTSMLCADGVHITHEQCEISYKLVDHQLVTVPDKVMDFDPRGSNTKAAIWKPGVLAGWSVSLLTLFLSALVITIVTLYWYSITHGLSERAFTYQTTIERNSHTIGTIAPYSIIPTLLGVITGLWWGSIEGVFRTVQPFIAMTRRPTISARGSGLSYQSSYLAWAGVRSWTRGHWLLALVCTGAFLSQIFTIAMSALWQPVSSSVNSTRVLDQPFQLREVPRLYTVEEYGSPAFAQTILPNVFRNFTSNWLYGAFSQLTANASEPIWSRDGWSFVPVSLDNLDLVQQVTSNVPVEHIGVNATLTVPAIRGRLECAPLASHLDTKYYTTEVNISQYNATARPLPQSNAYYLLGCDSVDYQERGNINFDPNTTATNTNCTFMRSTTSLLTANLPLTCCPWDENGLPENAIFSYWTPIYGNDGLYSLCNGLSASSTFDIAVKTLYGPSPASYHEKTYPSVHTSLIWPVPPSLTMLRCTPIIETVSSTVTIDIVSKHVQTYTILDMPAPYAPAWTDDYLTHEPWPGIDPSTNSIFNHTVSFGPMFLSALMGAAQLNFLGGCRDVSGADCYEDSDDQTFNYHAPGMNMDYMSYSMLALASYNMSAMLDHARMIPLAQEVFTTFFQHFVSNNVPMNGTGGWAYQRASETLPQDLTGPYCNTEETPNVNVSNSKLKVDKAAPPTVTAIISEPIEKLQMSPVAVYLCLAILVWLLVTTILILILKKRYFSPLLQPTGTIADVARLVVHSECYLELARERGATGLRKDKNFRTKLGWFRSKVDGKPRWGIELADDSRVDWLSDEEVKRSQTDRKK